MQPVFKKLELKNIPTDNFVMTPVELKDYIDFEVKRIYFISDTQGGTGSHCHKVEKELFLLQQGTATAVIDHGNGLEEIPLEAKKTALYVGNYVWHSFKDFSSDAILLALSSTNYDPGRSDYIEDYNEFRNTIKQ